MTDTIRHDVEVAADDALDAGSQPIDLTAGLPAAQGL